MYKNLNPLLHSQLRLSIMSHIVLKGISNFIEIKEITNATAGNISVQIKKLEKAKYLTVIKGFKNNYQHTSIEITKEGIDAFEKYVETIKQYIDKK